VTPRQGSAEGPGMNVFARQAPADPEAAIAALPVVDVAALRRDDGDGLESIARQIRHACRSVGFFYISNHGIAQSLIDDAFEQNRRFHALPLARKQAVAINQNNVGYLGMNASIQRHSTVHAATRPNQNESFFVGHDRPADHPQVLRGTPICGQNQWPADLPGFRDTVMRYFGALHDLAQRMIPAFSLALGMPADYLGAWFGAENHVQLRFLHYPPTDMQGDDFGTGPHTDNSFVTILARSEVPGLAIKLPSGEWLAPPLLTGTLLVNIGNIARRIANDHFLSTPHGVIVEGEHDRYSIAYFHSPDPYSTLEVAPSCTGEADPPRYPPALYADLILEFWRANYAHQRGHAGAPMPNRMMQ
jgi:isopenicillin N synthase-like dioxygenase